MNGKILATGLAAGIVLGSYSLSVFSDPQGGRTATPQTGTAQPDDRKARPSPPQSGTAQRPEPERKRPAPPPTEGPRTGRPAPPTDRHEEGPNAPQVGRAAPRRSPEPPDRRPGPEPRPHIVPYPGVDLGFWFGYPYGYPYRYPAPYPWYVRPETTGSVRLDVSEKDASVYVDGYYAGKVDDFDGFFRHLILTAGPHTIEISKPGFETLCVDIYIQRGRSVTYRATMRRTDVELPRESVEPVAPGIAPQAGPPPAVASSNVFAPVPGEVRLQVAPGEAQVYVDGYYVGLVNDFDGRVQRLSLAPGTHRLALRAEGYEPLETDVVVQPRQTLDYQNRMIPSPR